MSKIFRTCEHIFHQIFVKCYKCKHFRMFLIGIITSTEHFYYLFSRESNILKLKIDEEYTLTLRKTNPNSSHKTKLLFLMFFLCVQAFYNEEVIDGITMKLMASKEWWIMHHYDVIYEISSKQEFVVFVFLYQRRNEATCTYALRQALQLTTQSQKFNNKIFIVLFEHGDRSTRVGWCVKLWSLFPAIFTIWASASGVTV